MMPLGRLGTPQEYASLAVYLASDEHYLVGQVISPNGGMVIFDENGGRACAGRAHPQRGRLVRAGRCDIALFRRGDQVFAIAARDCPTA